MGYPDFSFQEHINIYQWIRNEYLTTERTYESILLDGDPGNWIRGYRGGKVIVLQKMMLRFLDTNEMQTILKEAEDGQQ